MQIFRPTKFTQWDTTENALPRVFYGGGKSQQSTSQVSIPPEVLAQYSNVNSIANQVSQTPFSQYSTDPNAFVAPLDPTQQAGIVGTNQASNEAQPYYEQAISNYAQATPANIQALEQQYGQQQSQQLGNAVQNGAFGGDRAAVSAANLNQQQTLGLAQGVGALAQTEGNLASGAQSAGLAGAQAQLTAGQAQQQTEQAGLTALYNQFLQQQSYPFQTTQFLANIAEGTGALSGSTTTANQPAPYFSDERLKDDIEPIGKTFDGLNIIKFKYKGDKQTHVGLSAQDVEKKHPHAVGLAGGYKTVDYDAATRDAAEKGSRKTGGLVVPIQQETRGSFASGGLAPNSAAEAGFQLDPSYLQAQQAAYGNAPWGNAGPVTGSSPYGGKSHVPPSAGGGHAQLSVAKAPAAAPSGLQGLSQGISQLEGLGKTGKSLYDDAKKIPGLSGGNATPPPQAAGLGIGTGQQGAPPPSPNQPVQANPDPNAGRANAGQLAMNDNLGLGSQVADNNDFGGLSDGLGSLFSKRGGRINRDGGGAVAKPNVWGGWYAHHPETGEIIRGNKWKEGDMPRRFKTGEAAEAFGNSELARQSKGLAPRVQRDAGGSSYTDATQDDDSASGDVPYDSGTGAHGLDIPDDKTNNKLATATPPSSNSGGGGGFNPLGLVTGALGLFGLASGGRVGLAAGGDPETMPIPAMDDAASIQQGLAPPAQAAALRAKAAHAGLNPDAPSPDAQPVQMQQQQDMAGPGQQHLTQPGEVLTQDNPGGVGDFLNRNQGLLVPALHGLAGMASSNSRYLGSAILQGLGSAADSYERTQDDMQGRVGNQPIIQQRQNDAAQSELGLYQSTIAQRPELGNLSFAQFEKLKASGQLQNYKGTPNNVPNGVGQGYNYSIQEKNNGVNAQGVPLSRDPAYLKSFAQHYNGVHSEMIAGQVNQANHDASEINNQGFTMDAQGNRVPVQGFESTALAQNHPTVMTAQAQKFQDQGNEYVREYGRQMSLFDELGDVYHSFQAGPTADWRASVSRLANEFDPGGDYPFLHNIPAGNDAANYDKARKDIAQLTASQLNALPGGAPAHSTDLLGHFAADPHLSPDALRDIVIRGKANLQQQADYYTGFDPFSNGAKGVTSYTNDFFKNQPFEKYRQQFDKTTPSFAGQQTATSGGGGQSVHPGAVEMLKSHPELAPQFDAKYGAGASKRVLGQ